MLQLLKASAPSTVQWEREVKWAKAVLSRYPTELSRFIGLKNDFSAALLTGHYDRAAACLERVEQEFGQSLWLIKQRIAFLQLSSGLEPQKRYAQQIKEAVGFSGPIALVAQWVSTRNENTVTSARFIADFEQLLLRIEERVGEGWTDYLRYHVLTSETLSLASTEHLLRIESTRALVDYYEAFISFCQVTILQGRPARKAAASYAILKLISKVADPRLPVLLTALGRVAETAGSSGAPIAAYAKFRQGHYWAATELAQEELSRTPGNAVALTIAALGKAMEGQGSTAEDELRNTALRLGSPGPVLQQLLISRMEAVVFAGAAASQEIHELNKLTLNFASLEWAVAPLLLLADEMSSRVETGQALPAVGLHIPRWHPLLLEALGRAYATGAYTEATVEANGEDSGTQYALGWVGMSTAAVEGLSTDSHQLLGGQRSYFAQRYAEAVGHGLALGQSVHPYFRRRGHRLVANSWLAAGEMSEACAFMARVYVREPQLQCMLPIAAAVGNLRPSQPEWRLLQTSLALPILLDAYNKHVSRTNETLCGYAYEDFLTANGLERPSQLRHQRENLDPEQVIYFLRYVCVEPVMDASTTYQSSQEVADERLAVCRLLLEFDPANAEEYRLEIKDLVRQQVISKRKHEVEQSRIHVEVPKLQLWATAQLQESYHRYLTFVEAGLDAESLALRAEATAKAEKLDYEGLVAMSVPNNETSALFRTLVLELRDAYTSSTEFGLNRYLSTRIRHGTLETQLRRPLTAQQLITQRESESGPYQPNTYWPAQLGLEPIEDTRLNKLLAEFSASYDALVSGIRTDWMQVRHNSEQVGLFEFTLTDGEITLLAAQIEADTTFRQFVDMVVEHLGRRLTTSLSIIRTRLRTEAWPAACELLNGLQRNAEMLNQPYVFGDLYTAINVARTETHAVFERVTSWFRPTQAVGDSPYMLEDVLSVAEALVQEVSPAFKAPLETNGETAMIKLVHGFPTLVDVFVNVFENVVRRSGLDVPQARLKIVTKGISPALSVVSITSTNALGDSIDRKELRERLASKQRELEEGKYASSIATEGGSGFFKIHRSLRDFRISDKEPEATLNFGIMDDEFEVEIQLPLYLQASLAASDSPFDQVQVLRDLENENITR
ncbi:hypothetical protein [Hymenobacter terrestris]|uniref:Uncharacterized protein n=1 Tax=Hymenobacter terrestris TaxID=2748310 RepID=A0ABX2Q3A5_9BACT|nr:hypothetical protein [Hymenobacter terrestris]NVO85428.1 hypothetical protein [Hymenobacter terrestris]